MESSVTITCSPLNGKQPVPCVEQKAENLYYIRIEAGNAAEIKQDDFCVSVVPRFAPTFHYCTHLTPRDGDCVDMHVFRSPVMIMQNDEVSVAVLPDLSAVFDETTRHYMDLDATGGRMNIGVSRNQLYEHVLYEKIPGGILPPDFVFSFYVMVQKDAEGIANPFKKIGQYFWENYGRNEMDALLPKPSGLHKYTDRTYQWAFENWKDIVWQQFEIDGREVGAPVFIVTTQQSPNYGKPTDEREFRSVWNQAWFSSLRSASGLYRYAKKMNRPDLLEKANLSKELALAAPMTDGIFPAVVYTDMEDVEIDGQKYRSSAGWQTAKWGNSNRNPYTTDCGKAPYHVLDMSFTAQQMLLWYTENEADVRLLEYCLRYAEKLVSLQLPDGFFPGWLDADLRMMEHLNDSPESAVSGAFLLELYRICSELRERGGVPAGLEIQCGEVAAERFLRSGLAAIDAACGCVHEGRWEDFETYWSCCHYGSDTLIGKKVERNDMYKQNTLSIYYAAEALLAAYAVTGQSRYLQLGERCIDELLMAQNAWQPPYMKMTVLGGFGVMNCDGELNDSRSSLFAELIVRYGDVLGRRDLTERGLAALRSIFLMMYCPENAESAKLWELCWPHFNELDYGFMMENYGHGGVQDESGSGIGVFTIYDWGCGAAAETYMRMVDHFPAIF